MSVVDSHKAVAWQDWAPPAALLLAAQLEIWVPGFALVVGPRWVLAPAAALAAVALCWRRRYPLQCMAVVAGALAAPLAFGWVTQSTGMALMLVVALFACGRYGQRPLAYLSVPIAALVVLAESFPDPNQEPAGAWGWSLNTLWVFALGAAFRHERFLRDRAAEATEARARAAHAEERLRLARDLHDVLSHSLAVVVVQAEVADAFLGSDREHSRAAIRSIAATGRSALEETRRLVTEMRDDESTQLADRSPGLAELPSLISRVRCAGLPVRLQMEQIPALSTDVTATAYRVVQESLTNVLRHAGAVPTDVTVLVDTSGLVIKVTNVKGLHTGTDHSSGHGLRGMRERVLACGGQIASGPDPLGGFSVRAVLPTGPP